MPKPRALPRELGLSFSVRQAEAAGVNRGRLRRDDLSIPYRGVRTAARGPETSVPDPFAKQLREQRLQARVYAPRLRPGQFFSHQTAVALRGGPLPFVLDRQGNLVDGRQLPVHVSTLGDGPLVRATGVISHRANPATSDVRSAENLRLSSAAACWAESAALPLEALVALGDRFCRMWRSGVGRPDVGRSPLTTIDELRAMIAKGRRVGIRRLRDAVELIREDSWSPRESELRVMIVRAGLPEPLLNQDVFDEHGHFLGCVDLAYPELKVAIEYHGIVHAESYSRDIERIAALRAAGWTVIEVTADLFRRPDILLARIRSALAR